jgi:hypothetical protein
MFHLFFNLATKVKKFGMHPNQVLKNFNVAHPLLKSAFFTEIDPRAFLREFLPEISIKNHLKTKKKKKKDNQKKKMLGGAYSACQGVAWPPHWPNGGG